MYSKKVTTGFQQVVVGVTQEGVSLMTAASIPFGKGDRSQVATNIFLLDATKHM